ncbi:MAG: hypothetical protein QOI41_2402, partial [Myxococcales bacterium]|nr:hypothetical protein [Myxococcales bacterium]
MSSDDTEEGAETASTENRPEEAKAASRPPPKSLNDRVSGNKKKKSRDEIQKELREVSKQDEKPPVDLSKIYLRAGALAVVVWLIALFTNHWVGWYGFAAAGALTVAGIVGLLWLRRYMAKTQALGSILKGA